MLPARPQACRPPSPTLFALPIKEPDMSASLAIRPTLYEETVPGGGHTSFVLKRGQLLRLTDLEGGANVSLMLLNAQERASG